MAKSEERDRLIASKIMSYQDLQTRYTKMRPPVIDGLLRLGETANVIAASKIGKSWLIAALAHCVRTGTDWLGFPTTQGRVLLVDNELHRETLSARLRAVAAASGLNGDYKDLDVLPLRGENVCVHRLRRILGMQSQAYRLVILDALYRAMPNKTSESDNADITRVYNTLDAIAAQLNSAIALVHHSSKGDQSGKAQIDVGSGAGAIGRACDVHITLRAHEDPGYMVMEASPRSFPALPPRVLRWDPPLWLPAEDKDPARLKSWKPAAWEPDQTDADDVLEWFRDGPLHITPLREMLKQRFSSERKGARALKYCVGLGLVASLKTADEGLWYGTPQQIDEKAKALATQRSEVR